MVRNGQNGLKTRCQVAFLQVKLDFGTLSPSLGRLGAPKLERPPHLACLSEAPCLLSSTGHLSLFGYALTIRPAIQGAVFKIIKEFFLEFGKKFFGKIQKRKNQKFKKSNFFFLENFHFSRKKIWVFQKKKLENFGFSGKKNWKIWAFQKFFLENLAFLVRETAPFLNFCFLRFQNSVGLNAVQCSTRVQSKRCPMFHARPIEQANGGNGPP